MKMQSLSFVLTLINLVLMVFLMAKILPARAQYPQNALGVLRGRSLEIVDSLGKLRASIKIEPPVDMNGVHYPQTVILRLIDTKGGPNVKLGAAENGSGLNLSNTMNGGVQIIAEKERNFVKLKSPDGREQVMKP